MEETKFLVLVNFWYRALGIWSQTPPTALFRTYSFFMLLYLLTSVLREVAQLVVAARSNPEEVDKNLGITLVMIVTIFKVLASRSEKMKSLMRSVPKAEAEMAGAQDERVGKLCGCYVKWTRFVCCCCYMGGIMTLLSDSIYAVLTTSEVETGPSGCRKRAILISAWVPFDRDCHYLLAYLVQCLDGFFGGIYTTGIDNMFLSPMVFAICYLEVIGVELTKVSSRESLRRIVRKHIFIIKFVEDLSDVMWLPFFLHFLVCSLHLGLLGVKVVMDGLSMAQVYNTVYALVMLMQFFLYYWHGSEIITKSEDLAKAAWNSNWYEMDEGSKKMLMMVIVRSQRALKVSAGPFSDMSNETFVMILQRAMSLITLFRQVYYDEDKNRI